MWRSSECADDTTASETVQFYVIFGFISPRRNTKRLIINGIAGLNGGMKFISGFSVFMLSSGHSWTLLHRPRLFIYLQCHLNRIRAWKENILHGIIRDGGRGQLEIESIENVDLNSPLTAQSDRMARSIILFSFFLVYMRSAVKSGLLYALLKARKAAKNAL